MLEVIPTCLHSLAVIKFHVSYEEIILCYDVGYIFHKPQVTDDTIFLSVVQSDM